MWTFLLQALITGILLGGIYALVSMGISMIFGVMNLVNFAQGGFLMISMYISYFLWSILGLDPYVSILICTPTMFVMGVLLQRFLLSRVSGAATSTQLLFTLGIMIVFENLALFFFKSTYYSVMLSYGTTSINLFGIYISFVHLISFTLSVIITILLFLFIKKTDLGRSLQATAKNPEATVLMGINNSTTYALAFGLGAALSGAAGALLTPIFPVNPYVASLFGLIGFVVVVLGGIGNIWGAFFGAMIIGIVESLTAFYIGLEYKEIAYFLIFIIILFFRPKGLFAKRQG